MKINIKTKIFSTSIIYIVSLFYLPTICYAQNSIGDAVNFIPFQSVPFNATKDMHGYRDSNGRTFGFDNSNNIVPAKLYDDIGCTQFSWAKDDDPNGEYFRKFVIPNSNNIMVAFAFGASDWTTHMLCVVSPSGQVMGTLESAVFFYTSGVIAVKQFRITAQNQIVITKLKPVSTSSILFENLTSFIGYRQDVTYMINAQGQFVQVSTQNYQQKTYTRSNLENKTINLWSGGETPAN